MSELELLKKENERLRLMSGDHTPDCNWAHSKACACGFRRVVILEENLKKLDEDRLKQDLKDIKEWVKEEFKGKFKKVKILEKVDILYAGWECDPYIWLVQVDKKFLILGTDHGSGYSVLSKEFLIEKMIEYSELNVKYVKWVRLVSQNENPISR